MFHRFFAPTMVAPERALPGRAALAWTLPARHEVLDAPLMPPFPDGLALAWLGMGCFWGAERMMWRLPGVFSTAVGYAGGFTPFPTYEEVCSGRTGHTEAVQVAWDPARLSLEALLAAFWEGHDPTQGMRQGNDLGTQYRSAIFLRTEEELDRARRSRDAYQERLRAAGFGEITTELRPAGPFYPAEPYHQQYLHKNPGGYCGLGGTGVPCPVGLEAGG